LQALTNQMSENDITPPSPRKTYEQTKQELVQIFDKEFKKEWIRLAILIEFIISFVLFSIGFYMDIWGWAFPLSILVKIFSLVVWFYFEPNMTDSIQITIKQKHYNGSLLYAFCFCIALVFLIFGIFIVGLIMNVKKNMIH
jgi:hypothetical protein